MTSAGMHQLPRREYVHLADIKPRSDAHVNWEHRRHHQVHWLAECIAEFVSIQSSTLAPSLMLTPPLDGRVLLRVHGYVARAARAAPLK